MQGYQKYSGLSFRNKTFVVSVVISIGLALSACTKLVTVDSPPTALTSENIYTDNATAASVLTNIYAEISSSGLINGTSINSISLTAGLSADELTLHGGTSNANALLTQFYQNRLSAGIATSSAASIWNDFYAKLYTVNIALENLTNSTSLTSGVRQQLIGEAKFLRAFFNFYLVNLYGDAPIAITSDYSITSTLSRNPQSQVYNQIIADLKDAQNLLTDNYVAADAITPSMERTRPNKWAATALLARTYLYNKRYDSAEQEATLVINNTALYHLDTLNAVFLKNSSEAIWQLQPVNAGWNTEDARVFVLPLTGPSLSTYPVYMSPQLLGSFEPGDHRMTDWVDSVSVNGVTYYCPFKYKNATLGNSVTEYSMVFRLGELNLIRAEAIANQNTNITGAQADLNKIRTRAGLSNTGAGDKTSLLAAIQHERQVELFTEWGHRWLDLKRTNTVDAVMNTVAAGKGTSWNTAWKLYPIPLYEITQDPNLTQNPAY